MYRKTRKLFAVCLVVSMLLTMTVFSTVASAATTSKRLAGADRYATALAIVKDGWTSSEYAVLATGEDFADALAAAPLAKAYNAPILLVDPATDNAALKAELTALGVKTVFIVGGEGVVSKAFADGLTGYTVVRLAGLNRVETSVKVAAQLVAKVGTISEIAVANEDSYADALSIAPIAANHKAPILLTGKDSLPSEVSAFLNGKTITKSYVVGETGVVSDAVKAALPNAVRLGGADRYATNCAILSNFTDLDYSNIFATDGENYPDALAGSAYAAKLNAPVILVNGSVTTGLLNIVQSEAAPSSKVIALGGVAVLPESAVTALNNAVLASSQFDYVLDLSAGKTQIAADGADNTTIKAALLKKATGKVDENADDVVVSFSTTWGSLAHTRVTLQNGVAEVTLTSEFSSVPRDAKITATLIEAADEGYKELIGQLTDDVTVKMVPATVVAGEIPVLVGAESNEANSVTLYFDKAVTVNNFLEYDEDDKEYTDLLDGVKVEVWQRYQDFDVLGFKPVAGNPKAIEAILLDEQYLNDNQKVYVSVTMPDAEGVHTSTSDAEFILTDARVPEATKAYNDGLKTVIVKFSEPIYSFDDVSIDAGLVPIDSADWGVFNPATLKDERNILTIHVGEDEDGDQVYLKAGEHSVQISGFKDYAGQTDSKNVSTTQILDFTVDADKSEPKATVTVESPEQFRIKFDKEVGGFDVAKDLILQIWDEDEDEWVDIEDVVRDDSRLDEVSYTVKQYDDNEYVVELKEDWTEYYNTDVTEENYYNDKFQFVIPEESIFNPANGLTNSKDIELELNYSGSPLNDPDTKSPTIDSFEATSEVDHYEVTLSEPVKLPEDLAEAETPSELQTAGNGVPSPVVEFIGKNDDGKTVTIPGQVVGYADGNGADMVLEVAPANGYALQELVNDGYDDDWKLVVRAISDDVGNTAASLTYNFIIKATSKSNDFEVAEDITTVSGHAVYGFYGDADYDAVAITFTDAVKYTGSSQNAANVANYQIDDVNLPKGSFIRIYDSDDTVSGNDQKLVVIYLPKGTLNEEAQTQVINIAKSLVSANGNAFEGEFELEFESSSVMLNATINID